MAKTPRATIDQSPVRDEPVSASPLYSIGYVSTQTNPMSNAEMLGLLEQAREHNARMGLTGVLLHRADSFFQVLEGGQDELTELFERIAADKRHKRVEIVTEGPIAKREYNDWQMAFVELDDQDFSAMPGFSDLMRNTPAAREFLRTLSRTKKLALLFSIMD